MAGHARAMCASVLQLPDPPVPWPPTPHSLTSPPWLAGDHVGSIYTRGVGMLQLRQPQEDQPVRPTDRLAFCLSM